MSRTTAVLSKIDVARFAREQGAHRLSRVVFGVRRALRVSPDSTASIEAVHDFRVSTRRFRAVLDTFKTLFPATETRRVKRQIRRAFRAAGEVRNIDISIELIMTSGMPERLAWVSALRPKRQAAMRELVDILRSWTRRDFSARWRDRLNLP